MRIKTIAAALALAGLALLPASPAFAFPPLPSSFYGDVQINGHSLPDGTRVVAIIGSAAYDSGQTQTYEGRSVYSIDIPGDDPDTSKREGGREGDTIQFQVGGIVMSQTAAWHSGTNVELNLSATSDAPPSTPVPTVEPTPTTPPTNTPQPAPIVEVIQPTVTPAAPQATNAAPQAQSAQATAVPAPTTTPARLAPTPTPTPQTIALQATTAPTAEATAPAQNEATGQQPDSAPPATADAPAATPVDAQPPQPAQPTPSAGALTDIDPTAVPTALAPAATDATASEPATQAQAVSDAGVSSEPAVSPGDAAEAASASSNTIANTPATTSNTGLILGVAVMVATVAVIGWAVFRKR